MLYWCHAHLTYSSYCLVVCKMYTTVEHDFCTTCYERPPVLRDGFAGQKGWSPETGSTVPVSTNFKIAIAPYKV